MNMITSKEEQATRLFLVRRTVMKMLKYRDYHVEDSDSNMTMSKFHETFKFDEDYFKRSDLVFKTTKVDDPSDQIFVFFPDAEKLNDKVIKPLVKLMENEKVLRAIVVAKQGSTVRLKNFKGQVEEFYVEIFQEKELLVDIGEHFLVPKHQVLTDEAKTSFLRNYSINELQLPRIQLSDPMARYCGAKLGQIVKISRLSETVDGEYVTFRFVV
ncbi:hypothetical protein CRYUN_Cryun28dG0109900 [Craigia yunnanensis]